MTCHPPWGHRISSWPDNGLSGRRRLFRPGHARPVPRVQPGDEFRFATIPLMFTLCVINLQFPPLDVFFETGYLCRSTWYDDQDDRIKKVIATQLHTATNRHVDGPPRRFCLTLTTQEGLLKAATMTPSEPHNLLSATTTITDRHWNGSLPAKLASALTPGM